MKINRSTWIALAAILLIIVWFGLRSGNQDVLKPKPNPLSSSTNEKQLPVVVTEWRNSREYPSSLELYGSSEANRDVSVKAKTAGLVVSLPIKVGQTVSPGQVICKQDIDARQAVLDQANALLKTRELEYKAAETLVQKGFSSETQAATAKAALDGAVASVKQAEIELDNVNIRAPFGGIFERKLAEIGDYISPGQACGLIVDLDPLLIVIELTESQVKKVNIGDKAIIGLATGEKVDGEIKVIDSRANASTRTCRTEIIVPNKNKSLKAGVSATVKINTGMVKAINIPSSILSLNNFGELGIRYVDNDNVVRFAITQTIDETSEGAWVTGLPDQIQIITQGQDYVAVGAKVKNSDNPGSP